MALRNYNRNATAQTVQAKPTQVVNNAGGYSFEVDAKQRLERFLVLGVDGGTYYVNDNEITEKTVAFISNLIATDEDLVRNTVVAVSDEGRAYRNTPAVFTMAMLMVDGTNKAATREVFSRVIRTSTHLFEFAQFVENLGGWGRSKRNAVASWYENKDADKLAYQLIKYRQRNGWTHRDLLRLTHPKHLDSATAAFALKGEVTESAPRIMHGYAAMSQAKDVGTVLRVLEEYPQLPWEAIPTNLLNQADVWKALFYNGQLRGQNALRNVSRLSKIGAFGDMVFAADFSALIADADNIKKSRLHPINYLNTIAAFDSSFTGGVWGMHTASLHPTVSDALDSGFHTAFKFVEPANKRTLLGLDVSSSMSWTGTAGLNMSCSVAGAAMAMTIARTEPHYAVMGFSSNFVDLEITPRMKLNSVIDKVSNRTFGGTDAALPMIWAQKNNVMVDTFVVITDDETWAGSIHPHQALRNYRNKMNPDARLAVIAMAGNSFSIADPADAGSMDFVGFDTAAPRALSDFSAGRI